jgi:hypothetical protein
MAKKNQLIDARTLDNVLSTGPAPGALHDRFLELAKAARKSGAGCVSMTMRFDDGASECGEGPGGGEYIPELMLRVRKP